MVKARLIRSMILTFALLLLGGLYAQAPDTLWTRTFGTTDVEEGNFVLQTPDEGYAIVGTYRTDGKADLIKTDSEGDSLCITISHLTRFEQCKWE